MTEKRTTIQKRARDCVLGMGDVFWDAHEYADSRDEPMPFDIAVEDVTSSMCSLLRAHGITITNEPDKAKGK